MKCLGESIRVRRSGSRSWLDYQWAKAFGAKLATRLEERCTGERGVFLTLTYQRNEYENPRDLYRQASEKKHVAEFIKRLARHLGESMTGRWICKMEFQEGGWVHWHLIVLGVSRIEHAALSSLWGFGHVWIKRMTKDSRRYMTKYVAKGDGLPAFLYAERPRSVKVIRTSKGFWNYPPKDRPTTIREESPQLDAYRPIGESLRRADSTSIVEDEFGGFRSYQVTLDELLSDLRASGYRVVNRIGSWLELKRVGVLRGASRGTPRLHLRRRQNRGSESGAAQWPTWLTQYFTETLDERWSLT
jgi:hypothetical protein